MVFILTNDINDWFRKGDVIYVSNNSNFELLEVKRSLPTEVS